MQQAKADSRQLAARFAMDGSSSEINFVRRHAFIAILFEFNGDGSTGEGDAICGFLAATYGKTQTPLVL